MWWSAEAHHCAGRISLWYSTFSWISAPVSRTSSLVETHLDREILCIESSTAFTTSSFSVKAYSWSDHLLSWRPLCLRTWNNKVELPARSTRSSHVPKYYLAVQQVILVKCLGFVLKMDFLCSRNDFGDFIKPGLYKQWCVRLKWDYIFGSACAWIFLRLVFWLQSERVSLGGALCSLAESFLPHGP